MSTPQSRLDAAEAAIGHRFSDRELLRTAITHPSWSAEPTGDWQRLEFLGDAVIGLVVAEDLYLANPDVPEGDLTKMRAAVVSGAALAEAGRRLGLESIVLLGPSELGQGERGMPSALEACVEAIAGAIHLDGGLDAARAFVRDLVMPVAAEMPAEALEHPRSLLQEVLQARGLAAEYRVVEESGPPHERVFTVEVLAGGRVLGSGAGVSKKDAGAQAAKRALDALGHRRGDAAL